MKLCAFLLMTGLIIIGISPAIQAQSYSSSDAVEMTANGMIDWTAGEVYAKGIGAPPSHPVNPAQARAMAERAAFVVGIRNLLETVKGVRVDSECVVENFMVRSDVIRTRVDGIVRGARIVKTQYLSDGSVEVTVGMKMKGALLNAIVPGDFGRQRIEPLPQAKRPPSVKPAPPLPPAPPSTPEVITGKKTEPAKPLPVKPAPEPVSPAVPGQGEKPAPDQPKHTPATRDSTVLFPGGTATGLVIDARGLGLRPALLPKILDEQGREVYVGQVVTRTNAVEQGVAGYAKDVTAASNNFRVTDNPAVMKAVSASGAAKTDLVLGQPDAEALRQLSSKGDFLQYCRVIIVY